MKFACSNTVPCSNIVLSNINLERKDGSVETYCNSAQGFGYGVVHPAADCLTSNDKDKEYSITKLSENNELVELVKEDIGMPNRNEIIHTELWFGSQ